MRLFSPCWIVAFLLVGSVLPVCAAPPKKTPPSPKITPQPLPPEAEATHLLTRGRRYERAAILLQTAIAANPDEYKNHLALGCAYADRAAALLYAAGFNEILHEEQKAYPKRRDDWEREQDAARRENRAFADPRPVSPPEGPLPTCDDNLPYRLTNQEMYARVSDLFVRAQAAWEQAATLAKTDAEKAHAEYVRGWGLRLLYFYSDLFGKLFQERDVPEGDDASANDREVGAAPKPKDPALGFKNAPTVKQVRAALERAVALAPDNALYWQALGDWEDDDKKKAAAFEKSLDLNPRNGPLWTEQYLRSQDETYYVEPDFLLKPGDKPANVEKGVGYLGRAAKYDRANAWYVYEEAALRMRREMFGTYYHAQKETSENNGKPGDTQKAVQAPASRQAGRAAIGLIETGNQRFAYRAPRYQESVPAPLAAAWEYVAHLANFNQGNRSNTLELAQAACGYGLAAARENNDIAEGLRATHAVIQMGVKLSGDMPLRDKKGKPLGEQVREGNTIVLFGLQNLIKIYEATGDAEAKARVQADRDVFAERRKAYSKAAAAAETQIWNWYYP